MDSRLATGAERFLRIAADASAPSVPVVDQPIPMDVVNYAVIITAASASARVDFSPTSPVETDTDIPMTEIAAPVSMEEAPPSTTSMPLPAQPKTPASQVRSKVPPPGFRASPKSTPQPTLAVPSEVYVDEWGDGCTVYPARSLRIDAEAAGDTDTQRLDILGRVDSLIDDVVNLRLKRPIYCCH